MIVNMCQFFLANLPENATLTAVDLLGGSMENLNACAFGIPIYEFLYAITVWFVTLCAIYIVWAARPHLILATKYQLLEWNERLAVICILTILDCAIFFAVFMTFFAGFAGRIPVPDIPLSDEFWIPFELTFTATHTVMMYLVLYLYEN